MEEQRNSKMKKDITANKETKPQPSKILTKPLPQILDEIEDSIKLADEAAKNDREAAEETRKAGKKVANEAARVAAAAIAKVEQIAKNAMELAELLNSAVIEAATILEKRPPRRP